MTTMQLILGLFILGVPTTLMLFIMRK